MSERIVEIAGLSRRFGFTCALDGVDLFIPEGRVFGLVGENGAGKTTLIPMPLAAAPLAVAWNRHR